MVSTILGRRTLLMGLAAATGTAILAACGGTDATATTASGGTTATRTGGTTGTTAGGAATTVTGGVATVAGGAATTASTPATTGGSAVAATRPATTGSATAGSTTAASPAAASSAVTGTTTGGTPAMVAGGGMPMGPSMCVMGSIVSLGSTALQPVIEAAQKAYAAKCPMSQINVQGGGSGTGLTQVFGGQAAIGMSDLFAEERDGIDAKQLEDHQVCIEPFAIAANPNVNLTSLTHRAYAC